MKYVTSVLTVIWSRSATEKQILREESIIRASQANSIGNYGMQHCGCEGMWMNPNAGQWCASSDDRHRNLIAQRPGSSSYLRKLLPLIYKNGIYWWWKTTIERLTWFYFKLCVQTASLFMRKNKVRVLLRLNLRSQFSKNQLQGLN